MGRRLTAAALALPTVMFTGVAQAHTGVGPTAGFAAGFSHPLMGLDHVLAMVTVGLWAAMLGGRALWLVPLAFVAAMAGGGVLGAAGIGLPFVEMMIAGSIVALGALAALRARLPIVLGMALVGLFAVFHGHAHGAEMPAAASAALYGLGFAVATALLHAAGIGVGVLAGRTALLARGAGAAVALAGVALLAGV